MKNALLLILALATITISGCNCVEVQGNEIAVIETLDGPQEHPLGPGLHALFGIRNDDFKYPINDQTFVMGPDAKRGKQADPLRNFGHMVDEEELLVKSKDGQKVWISLTLRYALDRTRIIHSCPDNKKGNNNLCGIHIEARDTYETKWIRPEVVRITKDLATEYTAKQIYAEKRPELNTRVEKRLADNKDLGGKGILVKTFVLDLVRLEDSYEKEIAATVLQDQRRIRAEKEREAAEEEAKAARAKAQASVEVASQKAEAKKITQIKAAEAEKAERMAKAEAQRYESEQEAIGNLKLGKADAEVAKLKRDSNYAGTAGERRMKVELAKYQAEAAKGLFPNATNVGDPTITQVLSKFLSNK